MPSAHPSDYVFHSLRREEKHGASTVSHFNKLADAKSEVSYEKPFHLTYFSKVEL